MNLLRSFIAINLTSLIVFAAYASGMALDKNDFSFAKESKQNGEIIVLADLSKEGRSKVKSVNTQVGREIEIRMAGEIHNLKLREPIKDNKIQMGPFSAEVAKKIVQEINGKQ